MQKLGLIDQAFYKLEQAGMSPAYMAGAMILDPSTSPYPLDAHTVADHIAANMEKIPLMRQKLVQDPLRLSDLRLVDDPTFDVRNHITVTSLKKPGGYDELTEYLGLFSAQRMDLSRPLWRYEIIDGLKGGKIAVASHLHHSILDGIGAKEALSNMWSLKPVEGLVPQSEAWCTEPTPTQFELMREALLENSERLYLKLPRFALKTTLPLVKVLVNQVSSRVKLLGEEPSKDGKGRKLPKTQRTSLNVGHLSHKRAVAYVELPLGKIKSLRKKFNCSINDIALLLNSVALEHYFDNIGEHIDFDLIAGMAINLRSEGDDSTGNQVSAARVNLHNTEKDIRKRLKAIVKETTEIKTSSSRNIQNDDDKPESIDFQELTTLFSPALLDVLAFGVTRLGLLEKLPLMNVPITNVPGFPMDMYIAGAKLESMVPMAPCIDSFGLTVTISSTAKHLIIGYHGCAEAIQDKELLAEGVRSGFAALKKAAEKK